MTIQEFQNLIERIYYNRDAERGVEGTFVWFTEEVGELAKEIRREPGIWNGSGLSLLMCLRGCQHSLVCWVSI